MAAAACMQKVFHTCPLRILAPRFAQTKQFLDPKGTSPLSARAKQGWGKHVALAQPPQGPGPRLCWLQLHVLDGWNVLYSLGHPCPYHMSIMSHNYRLETMFFSSWIWYSEQYPVLIDIVVGASSLCCWSQIIVVVGWSVAPPDIVVLVRSPFRWAIDFSLLKSKFGTNLVGWLFQFIDNMLSFLLNLFPSVQYILSFLLVIFLLIYIYIYIYIDTLWLFNAFNVAVESHQVWVW